MTLAALLAEAVVAELDHLLNTPLPRLGHYQSFGAAPSDGVLNYAGECAAIARGIKLTRIGRAIIGRPIGILRTLMAFQTTARLAGRKPGGGVGRNSSSAWSGDLLSDASRPASPGYGLASPVEEAAVCVCREAIDNLQQIGRRLCRRMNFGTGRDERSQ